MNTRNDLFEDKLELRHPRATDGFHLNQLVAASPPLDTNSVYCNLLQCQHFSDTSVAAVIDGRLVGFISGYIVPNDPETLFIWQVVVAESARGLGLAKRMLRWLVACPAAEQAQRLETTITPDNQASWSLFESYARDCGASLAKSVQFSRELHFGGAHDDEYLLRLAPLPDRPNTHLCDRMPHLRDPWHISLRTPASRRRLD